MAGNPFYQNLDAYSAPDPVTPADSPGDPSGYSMVTPSGRGTAPYNIQADDGQASIEAVTQGAADVAGAGVVYGQGTRQAATAALMNSPQGFSSGGGTSGYDITPGWSGEPDESWPNSPQPDIIETPDQGQMNFPVSWTMPPGVPQYGT